MTFNGLIYIYIKGLSHWIDFVRSNVQHLGPKSKSLQKWF